MPCERAKKIVLVTGASAGIGSAVARLLARQGHRLALTARRADRLEQLAAELRTHGAEVLVLPFDLIAPGTADRLVTETVARFGGLDVLINNAGFGLPTMFADGDPEAFRRQVEVNLVAPLLLTHRALPHLIERRGTIINLGSSITCVANSAMGAYGATKAGLAYWNDALRRDLIPHKVNVCLVEPGPVATDFADAIRALVPEGGNLNTVIEAPSRWMRAEVDDVARRIVRLIEHPKRRISVLRRVVWPFRLIGGLFQVWPALGDLACVAVSRRFERADNRSRQTRGLGDARPAE